MSDPVDEVDEVDEVQATSDDATDATDDTTGTVDENAVAGATAKSVLSYLARMIVDSPDDVVVEAEETRRGVMLRLHVAPDDMGKVIGRKGRVARALRTVVAAAGEQEGINAQVDIVD